MQERKTGLDIRLTETLRRRRDQLKSRLSAADDSEDAQSGTSLSVRRKELASLETRITGLTTKLQGMHILLKRR